MKKISLLFALVAVLSTASYANSSVTKPLQAKNVFEDKHTCTVTVKVGNTNATITYTCNCTQRFACDAAYALASAVVLP